MDFLEPADLLDIHGSDAIAFAQAQFCADTSVLAEGAWQWNAWLDAKGRVRHFFALLRPAPAQLLAWLPLGGADSMRAALAPYVFRAKVALETRGGWALHAGDETKPPAAGQVRTDGAGHALRMPGPVSRTAVLAPRDDADAAASALARWRRADIDAGLPWLAPSLAGEFLPQSLDLERLGAISFDKGCYPGQETAARVHFRGGNKRHLHRLEIEGGGVPARGESLLDVATSTPVGRLLYAASGATGGSVALAVIAGDGEGHALRLDDGRPVTQCVRVRP